MYHKKIFQIIEYDITAEELIELLPTHNNESDIFLICWTFINNHPS